MNRIVLLNENILFVFTSLIIQKYQQACQIFQKPDHQMFFGKHVGLRLEE